MESEEVTKEYVEAYHKGLKEFYVELAATLDEVRGELNYLDVGKFNKARAARIRKKTLNLQKIGKNLRPLSVIASKFK